jgi:putative beta-barrel porin MtrB/PioB
MKRTHVLVVLLACALLAPGAPLFAQSAEPAPTASPSPSPSESPAPTESPSLSNNWFEGSSTLLLLGRDLVDSSKFEEYRTVPRGVSMPVFTLQGSHDGTDFALFGRKVSLSDQRYTGRAGTDWLGVRFDYNQIPHKMGNDGRSIMTELAPGVWGMDATLRQELGDRVNARLPTATRNYDFFSALYAPTIAAAGFVDLESLRKTGTYEVDLGRKLPFALTATYLHEVKTGTRGAGGGSVRSFSDNIVEVPEPLDELTQDIGFRAALKRKWGEVHATFNHNWYNNRQETLIVDNPLVAFDQVYRPAAGPIPATGGTSRALFIAPPDNSADRGSLGALLKFARQTRVTAELALGRWKQDAQFYPYTIFSLAPTGTGAPASDPASLQFQSLDGKIDTTTLNLSFSSRPVEGLGLRARYRSYDLDNKTPPTPIIGSLSASPDRVWSNTNLAETPLGYLTRSPYGYKTARFDVSAAYDIKALTLEGAYRHIKTDRTYREAEESTLDGFTIAAILRTRDWLNVRASFDDSSRTPGGPGVTAATRLPSDEAERDSTRVGVDVEVTPSSKVAFILSYLRRKDEYTNPDAVAGVPGSAYGLLDAKYDSFTGEIDLTPSARFELGAYYTYEKNLSTTQAFSGGTTAQGLLNFAGSDETDTFGVNATVHLVPEKWTFKLNARRQKLDGLMDITGDPTGSFAVARAAYGGIQDITDYSDTELTVAVLELDYEVGERLSFGIGYGYEKYEFADAFSVGTNVYPLAGAFYLKANDGPYEVNAVYAKLNYRF